MRSRIVPEEVTQFDVSGGFRVGTVRNHHVCAARSIPGVVEHLRFLTTPVVAVSDRRMNGWSFRWMNTMLGVASLLSRPPSSLICASARRRPRRQNVANRRMWQYRAHVTSHQCDITSLGPKALHSPQHPMHVVPKSPSFQVKTLRPG